MLHFPTAWHSLLEGLVSLSARVNRPVTGAAYQAWLLRRMGATIEGPVAIGPYSSFLSAKHLKLGRYVSMGAHSRIVAWTDISIDDDFMASDLLCINSGMHDPITLRNRAAPIKIGKRVWCGSNVTICSGVEIGDDVIIGAGSVVTRSIPANWIAYGVPAKPARPLDRETDRVCSFR